MSQTYLQPSWVTNSNLCHGCENPRRVKDLDRRKQCILYPLENTNFCREHQYMSSYTIEQMSAVKVCKTRDCKKYFYPHSETAEKCPDCNVKMVKPICQYIKYDGNNCRTAVAVNGKYCAAHWKKYGEIPDEVMVILPYCKECKSKILPDQGDSEACFKCVEARKKAKENFKHKQDQTSIKCLAPKAKGKEERCLSDAQENGYCGKHIRNYYHTRCSEIGMKLCEWNLRGGCPNLLPITEPRNECGYCPRSKNQLEGTSDLLTTDIFNVAPYKLTPEWALQYLGQTSPTENVVTSS